MYLRALTLIDCCLCMLFHRKKRKSGKSPEDLITQADFALNLGDSRFDRLLSGDSRFGIDPLAPEYKATKGMLKILDEQQIRRQKRKSNQDDKDISVVSGEVNEASREDDNNTGASVSNAYALAQKLKKKFKK